MIGQALRRTDVPPAAAVWRQPFGRGLRGFRSPRVGAFGLAITASLVAWPASSRAQGSSTQQNPTVVFATPGTKTVTLTVCNASGCSTISRDLVVLSPFPAIASVIVSPARLRAGETVFLEATGTGRPDLSYSWTVRPAAGGSPVAILAGPSPTWLTAGVAPGSYNVQLTLANAFGTVSAERMIVVLPSAPTSFFTVPACRLLDTRQTAPLVAPGPARVLQIVGLCSIPANAQAVALNVTVLAPTAGGFLSVFPADNPHAVVSTVNFAPGALRSNFAVLPLATDGSGALAATANLGRPGSLHLLLDVAGYFMDVAPAQVTPLLFQARLCPLGFCEQAAGTRIFFTESFSGPAASYSYDWTGSGSFDPASPAPITSHTYSSPGLYTPVVRVSAGGDVATLAHPLPIFITPADPLGRPAAPAGIAEQPVGTVASSTIDPTLPGPLFAYQLSLRTQPPPGLLGFNAYVSVNGGQAIFVAALDPTLPPSELLAVRPFGPGDRVTLVLTAVNSAGESAPSAPILLLHP